jgi:uncharacterized protein (DUF58 family)
MSSAQRFRMASLVGPAAIAAFATGGAERSSLLDVVRIGLAALWLAFAIALAVAFMLARRREGLRRSPWVRLDVLTEAGVAMLWTGAAALVLSTIAGWASLTVVAVLGFGTVYVAVLWTVIVAGGDARWDRLTVTRAIVPAIATEGEPLREEIELGELAIPPGMRLFVRGRSHRHGAISRYVVNAGEGGNELRLEADLGPARRGEHKAPPLELWFGDVLGLTRTAVVRRGEARFSVLPRPLPVDGAPALLGKGGDAATSVPTRHAPTDGTFRIREYVPGDDARRIHWVRSLQQRELVVRLPDEVPPAEPAIRIVLDTELAGTGALTCSAHDELLDVMVRVWLGVGKTLAAGGTRVTLVTALADERTVVAVERTLQGRAMHEVLRLATRISWQTKLPLEELVDERKREVVVSCRPRRRSIAAAVKWIIVPEVGWTSPEVDPLSELGGRHLYPIGSPENRSSRRAVHRARVFTRWNDRMSFDQLVWADLSRFSGDRVVRPGNGRARLVVIP